ncbi:carbohydrate-binding domain-containing protein [Azospirillum sp. SYSU D00513]|uniref:CAP domain-containing protein n=1 Tax=Azospirillum sp. SYSU D00513 TaxID=2812561 RepID=UPI0032B4C7C5
MLELINRARANPAAEATRQGIDLNQGLAPGTISTAAKAPLAWDPLLLDSARAHSTWMLDTDSFSHTGAANSSPGDRMKAAGYAFSGSWSWGENIAIRWGAGTAISASSVEAMESGLFKSAGHRTNLMKDTFREIGIGLQTGEYQGSTGMTGTQNFARTAGNPFLTGVTFDDRDGDNFYDPGEGLGGVAIKAVSSAGTTYQATSWTSGGYGMELPAGNYTVTFSGGGIPGTITKTASIGANNVKLDLNQDAGTAPAPVITPPAPVQDTMPDSITVSAKGAGNAHFTLLVDGKKIGEGTTVSTTKDFTFKTDVADLQAHKVQIQFDNDGVVNGVDRNLNISKIVINGRPVLPTDGIVTYDKGALDGRDVVRGQANLWWNGTLVVNADKSFFDPGQQTVYAHLAGQNQTVAGAYGEAQDVRHDPFNLHHLELTPMSLKHFGSDHAGTANPFEGPHHVGQGYLDMIA